MLGMVSHINLLMKQKGSRTSSKAMSNALVWDWAITSLYLYVGLFGAFESWRLQRNSFMSSSNMKYTMAALVSSVVGGLFSSLFRTSIWTAIATYKPAAAAPAAAPKSVPMISPALPFGISMQEQLAIATKRAAEEARKQREMADSQSMLLQVNAEKKRQARRVSNMAAAANAALLEELSQ